MRVVIVYVLMYIHHVTCCHSTFDTSKCYCSGAGLTDCKNKGLTAVPPVLKPLNGQLVTTMDFRYNKIASINKADFKHLSSLRELDFRDNPLICCDILDLNDVMDSRPSLTTVLGSCLGQDNNIYSITQFSVFPGCPIVSDYCINVTCDNGGSCINGNRKFQCVCPPKYTGRMCELEICSPIPTDIAFVIDNSRSISTKYFDMAKQFVVSTTKSWKISRNHFRVAVLTFAENSTIELQFNDGTTKSSFHSVVMNLQHRGGISEIRSAIQKAETLLQKQTYPQFYIKPKQYIILITDGLTLTPSRVVYHTSVPVLAVAIGEDVSHYFLKLITGTMPLVFPGNSDSLGNYLLSGLIDPSCNICHKSYESDILFAVDVVSEYESNGKPTIPDILLEILSKVKISQSESLVGLLTFGNASELRFGFNDYTESERHILQKQLSFFPHQTGSSYNMAAMLKQAQDVLKDEHFGARNSSKKILLIFSRFLNPVDQIVISMLKSMKNESIEIFTIGTDADDKAFNTMSTIASSSFHIGIVGNQYTSDIHTFVEAFIEQLHFVHCQL